MNNLIEPCKKYISDKINVDLSTEDAKKYIMVAFNSLNFNNKTGLQTLQPNDTFLVKWNMAIETSITKLNTNQLIDKLCNS